MIRAEMCKYYFVCVDVDAGERIMRVDREYEEVDRRRMFTRNFVFGVGEMYFC